MAEGMEFDLERWSVGNLELEWVLAMEHELGEELVMELAFDLALGRGPKTASNLGTMSAQMLVEVLELELASWWVMG